MIFKIHNGPPKTVMVEVDEEAVEILIRLIKRGRPNV